MAILGIFELILGFIFRQNASVGSPEPNLKNAL